MMTQASKQAPRTRTREKCDAYAARVRNGLPRTLINIPVKDRRSITLRYLRGWFLLDFAS